MTNIAQNKIIFNQIKKEFYSLRNGLVATAIKSEYPEGTMIFGLMIPQIKQIASNYKKDLQLASLLRNDSNVRESRLLSFYLLPLEDLDKELAKEIIRNLISIQEGEIFAHSVLRHLDYAPDILKEMSKENSDNKFSVYCLKMLKMNLES